MKYWSRIILYNGDVSKNKLDLNDEVYNELYKKVDAIIHSAANVKHYGNYDDLYSSNVKTTLNLIEFSRKRKIDIHYISTISVIDGVTDTDYYLLNEMHYLNNRKSDNVYIRSKQEAESHLIEYREEGSIVNIYRVGNLVFNSKTGKFQENIQDNAFYTRLREFAMIGAVPIGGLTYDFSYVDAVAEAIITLFDKEKLTNNIFHLANNQNNVTLEQLADSFSKYGIIIKSMKGVDFIDFLIDKKEDKQLNQIIESIAAFSFNENEETNIRLMTTFDYTNRLLEKLGFKWPLFSSERIEKMVKHCKKVNFFN
jgi:thioester reductase-like protein